jgi:TolB-like protein/Flp pilus assembly protein TadD
MSPDPNDEYFADGLTEELIGKVSQIKGLEVIARTSVMAFKKKEKKVSDIARELNVGTVIEGSVRKAGNRIRVTVQVIDAGTEGHLFSSNYDSALDDIFAVQSDVAAKVAESVPGTILSAKTDMASGKETADTLAYTYFLKGIQLCDEPEEEPLRQGLRLLDQATQRDPRFARAYSGMAKCFIGLGNGGYIGWQEAITKGKAAVAKALELNPELAEAHSRMAEIMFMADDSLELRRAEVRRAIELNSNLAEAYRILANDSGTDGDVIGMVSAYEKAYQLDPLAPEIIRGLGRSYFYAGREEDALAHWKKTQHLEPYGTYRFMFDYYASKGEVDRAAEMVAEMEKASPTLEYTILNRGLLAAITKDATTAHAMIAKLDSTHAPGWARSSSAGFIYLELGDFDKFFEYMFRAVDDHTLQVTNLRFNPLLAQARSDPRFAEIFAKAKLPYKANP